MHLPIGLPAGEGVTLFRILILSVLGLLAAYFIYQMYIVWNRKKERHLYRRRMKKWR